MGWFKSVEREWRSEDGSDCWEAGRICLLGRITAVEAMLELEVSVANNFVLDNCGDFLSAPLCIWGE